MTSYARNLLGTTYEQLDFSRVAPTTVLMRYYDGPTAARPILAPLTKNASGVYVPWGSVVATSGGGLTTDTVDGFLWPNEIEAHTNGQPHAASIMVAGRVHIDDVIKANYTFFDTQSQYTATWLVVQDFLTAILNGQVIDNLYIDGISSLTF